MRRGNRTREITRRAAVLTMVSAGGVMAEQEDEKSFRYRIETVDAVFRRAKAAYARQEVTFPTYVSMVVVLGEEEAAISEEARAHNFKDLTEYNYWRRGRLKFPSVIQMELRLLEEGKDPGFNQN
jgi:hypothetical protein